MTLKPYAQYKDSDIDWLPKVPDDWHVARFKSRVRIVTDRANEKSNPVALENIEGWTGRLVESDTEFAAEGIRFEAGDVLFGKLRPYLAKSWAADRGGEAVGDFYVMRPGCGIDTRFLNYVTLSPAFISLVDGSTFGSKMPRASWEFIANIRHPFPSVEVQNKIVSFLDRETAQIDALIDKQERLIELLAEKRQAIITHAVTRGLDPAAPTKSSGFPWLGDIPGHWTVPQLGMHAKIGNGSTPNRDTAEYWSEGNIPWLNSSHVNRDEISDADQFVTEIATTECHLPVVGAESLLIGLTGQGRTRGMTSILRFPATINQHVAYVTPETSVWNPWYLLWFLRSSYSRLRELSDENGSTKGALTCTAIKKLNIALPPLSEQSAIAANIADRLAGLNRVVAACTATIEVLRERRAALISAAVTGQLNIQP